MQTNSCQWSGVDLLGYSSLIVIPLVLLQPTADSALSKWCMTGGCCIVFRFNALRPQQCFLHSSMNDDSLQVGDRRLRARVIGSGGVVVQGLEKQTRCRIRVEDDVAGKGQGYKTSYLKIRNRYTRRTSRLRNDNAI